MRLDEEWRIVPDHPNYMVSDLGRVKWLNDTRNHKAGDISTGTRGGNYYRSVTLDNQLYTIHRLVMLAFVGRCPKDLVVNHKNGKKYDNRLSNLEYVTRKEDRHHAIRTGLLVPGIKKWHRVKLTESEIIAIRALCRFIKPHIVAQRFGIVGWMVYGIVNGKNGNYFKRERIE